MEQTEYSKKQYQEWVKEASPNSKLLANCIRAFVGGGLICVIGQLLKDLFLAMQMGEENARLATAAALIGSSVLLTGLGWYDKLSEHIGAGASVPITGFANAIAAPAIEYKKEGYVLGVGAKMFVIAGPVILYGTLASILVGLIYYFVR
ncbi:MAG: stage V sporulation protein AC [Defluviitaleaceae bacterium]|nr:stage V sporulation protein AC [Defluviitaleaceae bacterium]